MKQQLFNPFIRLAGGKALLLGLLGLLLTSVVALLSQTHFNGVLDVHKMPDAANHIYALYFIESGVVWVVCTLMFYLAGLIFSSSSIRIIDVAGTMALARWPLIFAAVIGFFYHYAPFTRDLGQLRGALIGALLTMPFTIWMVALMYNAFTVCCNIKGGRNIMVFIVTLLLAEVAALFACQYAYHCLRLS